MAETNEIAISVQHVNKSFKLPHEKNSSIKSALVNFWRRKKGYELQHALKDISFEVKKGDFFGIVGRNGSGKSTLLKLLAGIYTPDSGHIQVNGKLTPFIELGVGFNPELSGRENVFLNGALLGFNRKEMLAMYDEIVAFAELERFMDQKLKNYSSGMQVRLAFSIAIRAQTDILVLDEVLAVGDESFQRKCVDVFERYKASHRTVILVTHDMGNITKFCDRALLLNDGKLINTGKPSKIADTYSEQNQKSIDSQTLKDNKTRSEDSLIKAGIFNSKGEVSTSFSVGQDLRIVFSWPKQLPLQNIGVAVVKQTGEIVYGTNTIGKLVTIPKGATSFIVNIELNLAPGRYYLAFGAFGLNKEDSLDFVDDGPSFIIKEDRNITWIGMTKLVSTWKVVE